MTDRPQFLFVLRGYRPTQVDDLVNRVEAARTSDDVATRAAAVEALRHAKLGRGLRGYERMAVDRYIYDALKDLTGSSI